MQVEREHLLPLAEEGFDLAEVSFPRVDGLGRVKVRTNFYSVPLQPGTCVQAKVYSSSVELWHEGQCRARHERCYGRQQEVLDLEHYLEVLERKPGALAGELRSVLGAVAGAARSAGGNTAEDRVAGAGQTARL